MGSRGNTLMPIIGKMYCSSSQVVLVVRRRPPMVGGGGFVVTNCSQKVVFQVDGCGTLGRKGELMLRDGDGDAILLIRQQGGIVQALSIHKKWKGYYDYDGLQKSIFSIKEPNACFPITNAIRISVEPKTQGRGRDWDFEVQGYFPDRDCRILNSVGNIIAQVGVKEEIEKVMKSKDVYHVIIQPGVDQAFIFGVIAVLDYIYHESTRC
ncbi:hypothetical protein RND81_06G179300 [Saponaria officinalis]|uniref:Protein LURP-one-related 6 n=1 Tax=Saponaria officinalis TaxID=3572 RepID=A0AAW1KC99_SAPOF